MKTNDYYDLRELISIQNKVIENLDFITNLLYYYGEMGNMTMTEVRDYFFEKQAEYEKKIKEKLGVT